MKVLIVSRALLAASYRQKLVELGRLGVDVTAVVPDRWTESGRLNRLEPSSDRDYRVIVTEVRFTGHFHAHYYPDLRHIIRAKRPDLVHLDEEPYNFATCLGVHHSVRAGVPSVFFTWQNINRRYPFPFRAMERYVYGRAARALAGNEEAANVLRRKGFQSPISVIPQFGIDPGSFRPEKVHPPRFIVGFVNRLVEAKGCMSALEALADLPDEIGMWMVGDGPERERLRAQIQSRGLESRVELRERIPSTGMPELLRNFSVVILPSRTTARWKEQFGRVLIEAMACGIPVVGSDSGEIPQVIGDAGVIVPEGDIHALAAAIRSLYSDSALRAALARRGRERVLEHFTNARIAAETYRAYVETLAAWERR